VVSDIIGLRPTLESLARTTWTDIAEGRKLGVPMGEVGITDHNMLALRREHPSILIHKYTIHEEVRTGADWEWWLGTSDGWICLVFQAKLLAANGKYPGITKGQAKGKSQIDVLLRYCVRRSEQFNGTVWPLYCFYNNWLGAWPEDVPKYDGVDPRIMPASELQLYGCAAADAWSVWRVLRDPSYYMRRTLRDSYLPVSRPWSTIFPDPAESATYSPRQTMINLSSWLRGRTRSLPPLPDREPLPPSPESETGEEEPSVARRDRMAIYRDFAFISRPPEYVFDLLQGRVQPRRLKPLARRIVILP
jgi:hypothetical protein